MTRKRLEGTHYKSWDDVDQALARIAAIERELTVIDAATAEEIDALKTRIKKESGPLITEKQGIEAQMKLFAESNRADLNGKSKVLNFGTVGFRRSTRIVIRRVAETVKTLTEFGMTGCLRIKAEPDKEAMANLTDEELASVGAARKVQDVFGYELAEVELAETN